MWKPIVTLTVALVVAGCSEGRHSNPEKPASLIGTYKGTVEGTQCGAAGPVIRVIDDVDFVFADSTYWWHGAIDSPLPEWGSGDYIIQEDSLIMTDCNFRLHHRCYIVTNGCFGFTQNRDTIRFWHEQPSTGYYLRATLIKED